MTSEAYAIHLQTAAIDLTIGISNDKAIVKVVRCFFLQRSRAHTIKLLCSSSIMKRLFKIACTHTHRTVAQNDEITPLKIVSALLLSFDVSLDASLKSPGYTENSTEKCNFKRNRRLTEASVTILTALSSLNADRFSMRCKRNIYIYIIGI